PKVRLRNRFGTDSIRRWRCLGAERERLSVASLSRAIWHLDRPQISRQSLDAEVTSDQFIPRNLVALAIVDADVREMPRDEPPRVFEGIIERRHGLNDERIRATCDEVGHLRRPLYSLSSACRVRMLQGKQPAEHRAD